MSTPSVRLPFAPVDARVPREPSGADFTTPGPHNWYGYSLISRNAGIARGRLHEWKRLGVPLSAADRAARAVGAEHPADLWGADYYAACDAYDALVSRWRAS